jgi:hypothetical protein
MLDLKLSSGIGVIMKTASVIAMAVAAACLADMRAAAAAEGRRNPAADYYITVPSAKHPGKKVTGLVRFGPHGDQVRLPNGSWVLCAVTCAVTLYQNTFDLWERRERYRWWAGGRPG